MTATPKITVTPGAIKACKLTDLGFAGALGEILSSTSNNLTCGVYEQKAFDKPLNFTYKYDEVKLVLDGELHVKDLGTGETVIAKQGDVLNISKGGEFDFSSPSFARTFFVGARGAGEL
ncbi:hypothetical protein BCV70DRAFT_197691 [Testicularia cyperi]|uniref:(S)-ureidoglycine aminohydrolase cupin domain-containing protein n=1 Tax=Testicularia cyperi TaxID=1882483 RepID=A0A317Y1H7_9BASI|nr:hypothetical protein BCV70DRAFT_197691 [Testicularia cyperi]